MNKNNVKENQIHCINLLNNMQNKIKYKNQLIK